MPLLGLISDTHGSVPLTLARAFEGVDEILHAGDMGGEIVEAELSAIAPVTAVQGNMDPPGRWPPEQVLERAGRRILLAHDIGQVFEPSRDFMTRAVQARADLVIFGHSHHPADFHLGPIRYINPGSAGHARHAPDSVALLTLDADEIHIEHIAV